MKRDTHRNQGPHIILPHLPFHSLGQAGEEGVFPNSIIFEHLRSRPGHCILINVFTRSHTRKIRKFVSAGQSLCTRYGFLEILISSTCHHGYKSPSTPFATFDCIPTNGMPGRLVAVIHGPAAEDNACLFLLNLSSVVGHLCFPSRSWPYRT